MTTPVATDDVVQGCVKFLAAQTDVQNVLGAYDDDTPYLFQHELWVTVERSSSTAAVITRGGGWAGANLHNTMRFPRIGLELYVDPQRDASGHITDPGEAYRRIEAAFKVIDRHLHMAGGGHTYWGTVRVSSARTTEPLTYKVADTDGVLRLQCFYAVEEG